MKRSGLHSRLAGNISAAFVTTSAANRCQPEAKSLSFRPRSIRRPPFPGPNWPGEFRGLAVRLVAGNLAVLALGSLEGERRTSRPRSL